jgi:hypothetical protein
MQISGKNGEIETLRKKKLIPSIKNEMDKRIHL